MGGVSGLRIWLRQLGCSDRYKITMLSRTALVARNIAKNKAQTRSMGDAVSHYKAPSMNEMPIPAGSWKEANAKLQRKQNLSLLAGVVFTAGTFVVAKTSGLIN